VRYGIPLEGAGGAGCAVHGILSGRRPVLHAEGSATHHPNRQPASQTLPARFNAHARARAVCLHLFLFSGCT
jgi:hypothetical protein